jgi:hypothetical protein
MVYDEEDFLMMSGIQHFAFCRVSGHLFISNGFGKKPENAEGNLSARELP